MNEPRMPLEELFWYLKHEEGLDVGVEDFKVLLTALQGGFGLHSLDAQKQLCKLLWAKSPIEAEIIDLGFENLVIAPLAKLAAESQWLNQGTQEQVGDTETSHSIEPKSRKPNDEVTSPTKAKEENNGEPITQTKPRVESAPEQNVAGRITATLSQGSSFSSDLGVATMPHPQANKALCFFHLQETYLDFGQRQSAQAWRKVRFLEKSGTGNRINVQETVKQSSTQGCIDLVYFPRFRNSSRLHILIDSEGSMAPFEPVVDELMIGIERCGAFGMTNRFYFHQFWGANLFRSPRLVDPVDSDAWMRTLRRNRDLILIVSDFSGSYGFQNQKQEERLLGSYLQLSDVSKKVAFLNPFPEHRWEGMSAEVVASQSKMFELTLPGLQRLSDYFRGAGTSKRFTVPREMVP